MSNDSLKVFSFSDVHLGHRNCLIGDDALITDAQRAQSDVSSVQRSNVDATLEDIIAECDVIVLNGDIIDKMPDVDAPQQERVMGYVMDRIEQWARTYPDTSFYYILGNHDAYKPEDDLYIQQHIQYDLNLPNLHFSDVGVIVGDVFFTHGDMGGSGVRPSDRHYGENSHPEHDGNENIAIYDALMKQLQNLPPDDLPIALVYGEEPKILDADLLSTMHMALGHTHDPIDAARENGKRIMNGGHLKSGSAWDRHTNATPADLHQSIITIEDGVMVDKQRAFPATERWEDMIKQRRTETHPSMKR